MRAVKAESAGNTCDVWTARDEASVRLLLPQGHRMPSLLATKEWILVGTLKVSEALASEISIKGYHALRGSTPV